MTEIEEILNDLLEISFLVDGDRVVAEKIQAVTAKLLLLTRESPAEGESDRA